MRVAVVDIGTNSTRLLIAEVASERVTAELVRQSRVTRLGQGVDATGRLAAEAMGRVFAVLADYRRLIDEHGATATVAVLTSAVRDAENGADFTAAVRERYGLDARTIPGAEEAHLTFLGATSERDHGADDGEIVVVDIGGGSTELVVGRHGEVSYFVSMQAGVVRQTERHLHHDPPRAGELDALAAEVAQIIERSVPTDVRGRATGAVAVAGTATSAAAIALAYPGGSGAQRAERGRSPRYAPAKVHGHMLTLAELENQRSRLGAMTDAERRDVPGLHPDRAPTIVAGVTILREVLRAFSLQTVEISEHDILRGAALQRALTPERA